MDGYEHPIAAIATPLAPAALGVIRASGERVVELLAERFSAPDRLRAAAGHTAVVGRLKSGDGKTLDEVVITVFRGPRSYTGEDVAEISCHGSPAGIRTIYSELLGIGFSAAEPGEFTRRAFSNGKLDLTQAEAVNEIVRAQTAAAHGLALDRLEGAVTREMTEIRSVLVALMAQLSIQLDYAEEDSGEVELDRRMLDEVHRRITRLAATYERGRLYQEGARVALAGRTNAGKSSIFNRLLQQERSIVSDIHGTTRDYLESLLDVNGIPVRLYDTAGLRTTSESVEEEGIRRSHQIIDASDLILYVIDAQEGVTPDDQQRVTALGGKAPVLRLWNKTDLLSDGDGPSQVGQDDLPVSAATGTGIAELVARMEQLLLDRRGVEAEGGVAIDSARQHAILVRAAVAVAHTSDSVSAGMPADAVAVDLQDALSAVGEITGEVASAEILDQMFGSFCVGK